MRKEKKLFGPGRDSFFEHTFDVIYKYDSQYKFFFENNPVKNSIVSSKTLYNFLSYDFEELFFEEAAFEAKETPRWRKDTLVYVFMFLFCKNPKTVSSWINAKDINPIEFRNYFGMEEGLCDVELTSFHSLHYKPFILYKELHYSQVAQIQLTNGNRDSSKCSFLEIGSFFPDYIGCFFPTKSSSVDVLVIGDIDSYLNLISSERRSRTSEYFREPFDQCL